MTNISRDLSRGPSKVKRIPTKVHPFKNSIESVAFYEKWGFLTIVILAVTFIAFLPSIKNDFISTWDDDLFVINNLIIRRLDFISLKSIFITPVAGAYVPLPILTFAVEYHFFGLNPIPYHVTNLILHLICTLLVFQVLRSLKLNSVYAAFGALIFGIHPMHVESVAWVTERKDLLYGIFYLASMIAYLKYLRQDNNRVIFLLLSLVLFIFALFSKIQAVTLPICLFLIDYYTHRPYKLKLIVEKIPFIILSLVFGMAGIFILQKQSALQSNEIAALSGRVFPGLNALSVYILKFFAPYPLSALYPYPIIPGHALPVFYYLIPIPILFLGFLIYKSVRRTRAVVFGALFFLVNVMFMIQILVVGSTYLSDRYAYIPYVGFCFVAGWSMEKIMRSKKGTRYILLAALCILVITFISVTYNRCKVWKNSETLWTDVIEKYPDATAVPYNNRGFYYNSTGQWDKAIADCSKAIEINPGDANAYSNRGFAFGSIGNWNKAVADCSRAIGINPNDSKAYSNRGLAYGNLGQWEKVISDCTRAIEINPNDASAYSNRGFAYGNTGNWEKAISDCSRMIEINPNDENAYSNRGLAYCNIGKWDKAVSDCSRAIAINPDFAFAYLNRGNAYRYLKEWDKAVSDCSRAIEIDQRYTEAYYIRGNIFATQQQWEKAVADYSKVIAIDANYKNASANREIAYRNLQARNH